MAAGPTKRHARPGKLGVTAELCARRPRTSPPGSRREVPIFPQRSLSIRSRPGRLRFTFLTFGLFVCRSATAWSATELERCVAEVGKSGAALFDAQLKNFNKCQKLSWAHRFEDALDFGQCNGHSLIDAPPAFWSDQAFERGVRKARDKFADKVGPRCVQLGESIFQHPCEGAITGELVDYRCVRRTVTCWRTTVCPCASCGPEAARSWSVSPSSAACPGSWCRSPKRRGVRAIGSRACRTGR